MCRRKQTQSIHTGLENRNDVCLPIHEKTTTAFVTCNKLCSAQAENSLGLTYAISWQHIADFKHGRIYLLSSFQKSSN